MKRAFRHVRSNVIGYVALFIALGGTSAYAADTVFSTDIKDGEVKTADLANAAVTNAKLGANAVNTGKVENGSLTAQDLAPGVGGSGATAIAFAPSGCTGNESNPSPGCTSQQSLPGGFVLKESCFANTFVGVILNVSSESPGSSVTNTSYNAGDQTSAATVGRAMYGGFAGPGTILDEADTNGKHTQLDGQIVYRRGATLVTVNFSGYVNSPATRCEFFATAVSNG